MTIHNQDQLMNVYMCTMAVLPDWTQYTTCIWCALCVLFANCLMCDVLVITISIMPSAHGRVDCPLNDVLVITISIMPSAHGRVDCPLNDVLVITIIIMPSAHGRVDCPLNDVLVITISIMPSAHGRVDCPLNDVLVITISIMPPAHGRVDCPWNDVLVITIIIMPSAHGRVDCPLNVSPEVNCNITMTKRNCSGKHHTFPIPNILLRINMQLYETVGLTVLCMGNVRNSEKRLVRNINKGQYINSLQMR